ncbi:unnamed protein product [Lathyrus oleraceus]
MTQILMLIYAFIIFSSPFLVVTSETRIPCIHDNDCPVAILPMVVQCIDNFCKFWNAYEPKEES